MAGTWARFRVFVFGLLVAGLWSLAANPVHSDEKVGPRDKEIADLEKQVEELNKRLAELRKNHDTATVNGQGTLASEWIKALVWRAIGPASMGGRITAISVFEADPSTYFVATASGGLLKTVNNGVTFEHMFDRESTVSIGDVCVAPSDRNIVWVGTGENNPRNSVSYGDGVYKSTDGGKTWKNMGLKKSFQIGRIVVHPKNPNIVYVGALGRLYGPSEERGLYKTTDGGVTWERILYVDNKTGVIDIQMHPSQPETLLVATYERERDLYDTNNPSKMYGPGGGLYKTIDGGKTFKKLTKGLPTVPLGRIGIDFYRKNPNTVFVILESQKNGFGPPQTDAYMGIVGEDAGGDAGAKLTDVTADSPAAKAAFKTGDVIVGLGEKPVKSYEDLVQAITSHKPGDKLKVKIKRQGEDIELELTLGKRPDEGQGRPRAGDIFLGLMGESVEDAGIKVTRLVEGAPAEKAGIQEGDIISAVAGKKVRSYAALMEQIRGHKAGDKIKVTVSRGGKPIEVEVTLTGRAGGFGPPGQRRDPTKPFLAYLSGQQENVQGKQGPDGFQSGGVYKSTDGGETWTRINSLNPRPMYFSVIRVDPSDDKNLYVLGVSLHRSTDGGKTFKTEGGRGVHADQHALWIDPKDGRHMVIGCDGGFYVTYDRGGAWDHLNHLAIGQFYHVALDTRVNYHVYGGLQDNGSWGGPSQTHRFTGPVNQDWISVGGGDGFVCQVDPNDPDQVYWEMQNGGMGRRNLRTGETSFIRPRAPRGQEYRFNWKTPYILSHHNSRIFYCAGNYVFRSLDRGNDLRIISPEITRTKQGSATALAESPRNPNVLYVGTDDGHLWVTKDGGKEWTNITAKVSVPKPSYVATIEASRFDEGRAYVVFDAHRSDDDNPYVFVTEDFGQTWKSLRSNLPWGSTHCLREDIQNPNLLFLGTEFAAWVSVDRGATWTKLNNNLPTVAVHDFAIHPTVGEIVAATHGRSLWILDVTPLRQLTPEIVKAKVHLYRPNTAVRWRTEPSRGGTNRQFAGQNPPAGAQIFYSLTQKAGSVNLKIVDVNGKTMRELKAEAAPGLHRLNWDLTMAAAAPVPGGGQGRRGGAGAGAAGAGAAGAEATGGGAAGTETAGGGAAGPSPQERMQRMTGRGMARGQPVAPGFYRVVLTVDGQETSQPLRVEGDAASAATLIAEDEEGDPSSADKDIRQ
jgi:photosystem II stability/assembly factor-like uncharacterized protein